MTDKYIEISKEAAEAAGVPACVYMSPTFRYEQVPMWLVHDNGACAELAAEYRISQDHSLEHCVTVNYRPPPFAKFTLDNQTEKLSDHNNDRMLATNYAILSAVIEINKVLADKGEK